MRKKILTATLSTSILLASLMTSGCDLGKFLHFSKTLTYGIISYGVVMGSAGIDPHQSYFGWSAVRYGVGETLFKFNDRMELEPWLADNYEFIDENTLRIHIRDNVCFSNGKKVDGMAVKKCFEDLLARHDRAPEDLKIASITAEDQVIVIHSDEKIPAMINFLSDPYCAIVDVDAGFNDRLAIGTGPYVAEKLTDTQIDLVPNENYWGAVKPKLDHLVIKGINNGEVLTQLLQNGEIDAAHGISYENLQMFDADPDFKFTDADTSRDYQIAFNFDTPELQDIRIRQAICMAVDKDYFAYVVMRGNGTPAAGPFPANTSFGGDVVRAPDFDLDYARELIGDAGYFDSDGDGYVDKDGKNLELRFLTYTSRAELPILAEHLRDNLQQIGIKLEINATDAYKAFVRVRQFDLVAESMATAPTGDPEYYFMSHIVPEAVDNVGNYYSPEILRLTDQLHNTFDKQTRSNYAIQISQQIVDDCALCYVAHQHMSVVTKSNVYGLNAHPSEYYGITSETDLR